MAKKAKRKTAASLNARQRLFVRHYVVCLNATEAARHAGYSGNNNVLAVTGHENLRNPKIRAAIDQYLEAMTMSKQEVLGRLTAHARSDMGDLVNPETNAFDWKYAREMGLTHLIKEYEEEVTRIGDVETRTRKVKLHDSQAALVHLGKSYSLFKDVQKREDWRSEAIELIRDGKVDYHSMLESFNDTDLVHDLFRLAGVEPVVKGDES